jgi:hypothetical protein
MASLTLFYQIISVTISYSEFETVIDMKAISNLKNEPTFTLCLKNDFEFPKRAHSFLIERLFHNPIGCGITENGKEKNLNCGKFTKIVESVITLSQRCRSYSSQLLDNKSMPLQKCWFLIDSKLNIFGLLHQKKTPPHFERQKIEISKSNAHIIENTRIVTKLLPFPYSTDCYNYGNEVNPVLNYKSREDCSVKHLEQKEFIECGCNKRWFYGFTGGRNFSQKICPKSIECKFDAKSEMKSLENICKNNCLNEYYMNIIDGQQMVKRISDFDIRLIKFTVSEKYEILFTYLPKMNLIEYLCSVGGLISMWFGISVYDLVLIFVKESKKNFLWC